MTSHILTIEFPGTAQIPQKVGKDQDLLRYAVVGTLYARGLLSEKEARRLTGDSEEVFEEKLRTYGFTPPAAARASATDSEPEQKKSRWALAAEFFSSEKAGHLDGRSGEVEEYIQEFRRSFRL